jgi:uncharacterized DUF497 family protein
MDQFEWDPAKNAANLAKHGISFEEAKTIWEGPVVTGPDHAHDSEEREISFGFIGGVTVACVVHTDRYGKIRIISARKATRNERKEFDAYLKNARS